MPCGGILNPPGKLKRELSMWKNVLIPGLLLLFISQAQGQSVDTAWVKKYDAAAGGYTDWARAIAVDDSGCVYVTGQCETAMGVNDILTIKYLPNTDTAWVRRYNGTANDDDIGYAIAVDRDRNVYVAGTSEGAGTSYDFTTIKYRPNGSQAWVVSYNGPGFGYDMAYDIAVDQFGEVYVTGYIDNAGLSFDYYTVKYDTAGTVRWSRTYNYSTFPDYGQALVLDTVNGYVYVTGYSYFNEKDFATVSYTTSGTFRWAKRYDHDFGDDYAFDIALDSVGHVIVAGTSYDSTNLEDLAIIRYEPVAGGVDWIRRLDGTAHLKDSAVAVEVDNLGKIHVAGNTRNTGSNLDMAVAKYDTLGNFEGVQTYSATPSSVDLIRAMQVRDAASYVVGYTSGGAVVDMITMKTGDWVRSFNGPANWIDDGQDIVLDKSGNIFVCGYSSFSSMANIDYATIRYSYLYLRPLIVVAYSPVNLRVTDPNGDYIGKDAYGFLSQTLFPADYREDPPAYNDSIFIYYPIAGEYIVEVIPEIDAPPGSVYSIGVRIDGTEQCILVEEADVPDAGIITSYTYVVEEDWHYINGDANRDGIVNILDILYLIDYKFKGGPPPDPIGAGDTNCNLVVNIIDIVYLIDHKFKGGPEPCDIFD